MKRRYYIVMQVERNRLYLDYMHSVFFPFSIKREYFHLFLLLFHKNALVFLYISYIIYSALLFTSWIRKCIDIVSVMCTFMNEKSAAQANKFTMATCAYVHV